MIYSEEKDGADSLGEIIVAVHVGGHERELRARNCVVVCASLPLERGKNRLSTLLKGVDYLLYSVYQAYFSFDHITLMKGAKCSPSLRSSKFPLVLCCEYLSQTAHFSLDHLFCGS